MKGKKINYGNKCYLLEILSAHMHLFFYSCVSSRVWAYENDNMNFLGLLVLPKFVQLCRSFHPERVVY